VGLEIVRASYAQVQPLFVELDADLDQRYGAGMPVLVDEAEFERPGGALFLALLPEAEGDDPVAGCAGVRPHTEEVAELKRMYVRPAARRHGVARALLLACEQFAAAAGYAELWLETGMAQPEALTLYRSAGYRPVPRFGQYADARDARHLGRRLGSAPGTSTADAGVTRQT